MLCVRKGTWTMGIPGVLSVIAVMKPSVVLFAVLFIVHFALLRLVPAFKGRESVWMFLLVAISSIPINVCVLIFANEQNYLFDSIFLLGVLRIIIYYSVLFSLEEIAMGVITRLIWKKQYKLPL